MDDAWATDLFRDEVGRLASEVPAGPVRAGAMGLWQLGLSSTDTDFGGGLWQIWGRITDEFTRSEGDDAEGERLALESAAELRQALGDEDRERAYCDRWIDERLDIV